tara:strand:- start:287 stop:850 length:564 start_codon:yes stop_codon:yes gene_type:complete
MPKNKLGGNKAKKMGKKYIDSESDKITRIVKEEGELYAVVTKLLGGSHCEVICEDNIQRLCVIRRKFRGRGKRDNTLSIGTWIMIGARTWETVVEGKMEKCDLLEVYSSSDRDKIIYTVKDIDFRVFNAYMHDNNGDNENDITFDIADELKENTSHNNKIGIMDIYLSSDSEDNIYESDNSLDIDAI